MKKICFTGHRNLAITPELKKNLFFILEKLITEGATDFYAGGALGWDIFCEYAVCAMKEKYPHIRLHLILPCSAEEQTSKWTDTQKKYFYKFLSCADSVEYTSEHYSSTCMKIRNARLVELADVCICYYSGKYISGTGQTIRMAERKKIRIINFYNI